MTSYKHQDGYVALLSVLILGAIATSVALALLMTGTDSQRSSLVEQQSKQAQGLAVACAEEALQIIHDTTSFTGTNNLILSTGTCIYTVTNNGGASRTIVATGTAGNVVKKLQVYVTIGASSISVTSWQEVS